MNRFEDTGRPMGENGEGSLPDEKKRGEPVQGEGFTFVDPAPAQGENPSPGGQEPPGTGAAVPPPPWERKADSAPNPGWGDPNSYQSYPPQGAGNYPPFHENAAGGWNQGAGYHYTGCPGDLGGQNADGYKWNFEDYEHAAQSAKPKVRKSRGLVVFAVLLCTVSILSVALFAGYSIYNKLGNRDEFYGNSAGSLPPGAPSTNGANPGISVKDKPEVGDASLSTDGRLTTAQVAKMVSPSVVGIANYQGNNSFTPSGEGSGIIMTEDGYIVTNAHVVEGAKGLTVTLNNGETYAGQLIGLDMKTDLAVVKIQASNLTFAEFGNSDQVEVGEDVVAIGNPTGMLLAGSVTKGIVSAVNRVVDGSAYSTPYIQTDAAINPGNSGGALVNEFGQVIGINSAKLVATDYEGIGFAIPINSAMPIIRELIANGRVTGRAELGLTGQMVDETLARFNGTPSGVGIVEVKPNSDLARKNVVPGDIITKINDEPILNFNTLTNVLATKKPGDTVKLTIYRRSANGNGKSFDVNVTLIEENTGG